MKCEICQGEIPLTNFKGNYMYPSKRKERKACSVECATKLRFKDRNRVPRISSKSISIPERIWSKVPVNQWSLHVEMGG